jgi:hypothetical protein
VAKFDPEQKVPKPATDAGVTGARLPPDDDGPSGYADRDPFDEGADLDEELDGDEDGEPTETIDELGRRHVRRGAPEGTEELLQNEAPRHTGLPDGIERWRSRTAAGAVFTAVAFGLQQVFEPDRKQPAIIMQTSGDPPKDLPVEAHLEQLGARRSSVTVRSWLLGNNAQTSQVGTPDEVPKNEEGAPDEASGTRAAGDEAGAQ